MTEAEIEETERQRQLTKKNPPPQEVYENGDPFVGVEGLCVAVLDARVRLSKIGRQKHSLKKGEGVIMQVCARACVYIHTCACVCVCVCVCVVE